MPETPIQSPAPADYNRVSALAKAHYENFPVGKLIRKELRPHVHAIYAFARFADDIADEEYCFDPATGKDEGITTQERHARMIGFREQLSRALEGGTVDPVLEWIFAPLIKTTAECKIPPQLYFDLLSAFEQDILKRRYANFAEVADYCTRSANPIGRLVLHVHDIREEALHLLSDEICTGLQLANFWQDVSVDLKKDRLYLPEEDLAKFGISEKELFAGNFTPACRNLLEHHVALAREFFERGKSLPSKLGKKLSLEIRLTWLGGVTILDRIHALGYNTLQHRPRIHKWDILWMLPYAWCTRNTQ